MKSFCLFWMTALFGLALSSGSSSFETKDFPEPVAESEPIEQFDETLVVPQPAAGTVDLTSLTWISKTAEFADFAGILILSGHHGYLKSLEIVTRAFFNAPVVSEHIKIALFEELKNLAEIDPMDWEDFLGGPVCRPVRERAEEFIRFAVLQNDFDLVSDLIDNTSADIVIDDETAPNLRAYLRAYPIEFSYLVGASFDFLTSLELTEEQLKLAFKNNETLAVKALKWYCSETPTSRLFTTQMQDLVIQIYNLLSSESKLKVQKYLASRSLLADEEVSPEALPLDDRDSHALLLGPIPDLSAILPIQLSSVLNQIERAAEVNSQVVDWFIQEVDLRYLILPEAVMLDEDQISAEIFKVLRDKHICLSNKNLAAFLYSGQPDFLKFLREAPVELLDAVGWIIAFSGSAEEFALFMTRAEDDSILSLFEMFWDYHDVQEDRFECASLLLERLRLIPQFLHPILCTERLIKRFSKRPDLLIDLNSIGGLQDFASCALKEVLINVEFFQAVLPHQHVFVDYVHDTDLFELPSSSDQVDRFLQLVGMSAHETLQVHWRRSPLSQSDLCFDDILERFAFLKRWKRDHPDEIAALLVSDNTPLDELIDDRNVHRTLDQASLELIRAYLILGRSMEIAQDF